MRSGTKIALAAVGLLILATLILASYWTTSSFWEGGFPDGEFRVNVRDPDGKPVRGAVLRVYHGGTRDLASGYPLDDHRTGQELVSDESGRITAIRKRGGLQFGWHSWRLFWVIPMGMIDGPKYDCEITADGCKPLKFPVWRLFDSPHQYYEDFPKTKFEVDGEEAEFKIYEHSFTLER